MSFELAIEGRRALVTGGTKGVGAAVVDVMREAGVTVIATARTIPDTAPYSVHHVAADVSTAEGCAAVSKAVLDQFGGIDFIINVVGGSSAPAGSFAALDDNEWRKELDLNLMPAVRLDRARQWASLIRRSLH